MKQEGLTKGVQIRVRAKEKMVLVFDRDSTERTKWVGRLAALMEELIDGEEVLDVFDERDSLFFQAM